MNFRQVIGIDEVGRGAWAGPLLVVALRQNGELSERIKDSKLLSATSRGSLIAGISEVCDIGEGWVMPAEIDNFGLTKSMQLAVARALSSIGARHDERIVIDGNINYVDPGFHRASAVIDADALFPIVSAASIVAKVTRDKYMTELPSRYGVYEFDRHVGYGTKLHLSRLQKYGISDMHRKSFAPVKVLLEQRP